MKKILLTLSTLTAIFLTACGGSLSEGDYFVGYTTENGFDYGVLYPGVENYNEFQLIEIEGVIREIRPRGSLTIDDFLADLDYMVYVLENNFALLDVAYWAHGVNYRKLTEKARGLIKAMEKPCEDAFSAIMVYSFLPLQGIGHFQIFNLRTYHNTLSRGFFLQYQGRKNSMNQNLVRSPLADRFYRPYSQERLEVADAKFWGLVETYGMPHNHLASDMSSQPVTTEILEEGQIAYIYLGRFLQDIWNSEHEIHDFKRKISGFEHLILDLRGNVGGDVYAFLRVVLSPHLIEPIEAPRAFAFFLDGPHIRRFGDFLLASTASSGYMSSTESYRPIHEILAEHYLPEFNQADVERLDYGAPYALDRIIAPHFNFVNTDYAFEGKIWLLVDEAVRSGSQLAAWHSKETGFATLVGEVTGGAFGGPPTLIIMPNTGMIFHFDAFYITDSHGRPLEAGVVPHHFNLDGLNALETVLELIAEGVY
jgi:hypothetical protein